MSRDVMLLQKRVDVLELTLRRITQIESKPRLILGGGGSGTTGIQGTLQALEDGEDDYAGMKVGSVLVVLAPCDEPELAGTTVDVIDWSGCVFDHTFEELDGVWVWAGKYIPSSGDCHWATQNRCCVAADTEA